MMKLAFRKHLRTTNLVLVICFATAGVTAASPESNDRAKAQRCTAKMALRTLERCQLDAIARAKKVIHYWKTQTQPQQKPRIVWWHERQLVWLSREVGQTRALMAGKASRPTSTKSPLVKRAARSCDRKQRRCEVVPVAPSNLKVTTAATQSTISMSWSPSGDGSAVSGYGLYVNGQRFGQTSSTEYAWSALTCGTSYELGVDAFNASGSRSTPSSLQASTAACSTSVSGSSDSGSSSSSGSSGSGSSSTSDSGPSSTSDSGPSSTSDSGPSSTSDSGPSSTSDSGPSGTSSPELTGRWWVDSSPLNTRIPSGAAVHPNSQAMIDAAIKPLYGPVLDTAYGTNVYYANASTPLVKVTTDRYPVGDVHYFPIPAKAEPTSGSDSKLGVIRADTGEAWELWLARKQSDGTWVAGSAGKTNVKTASGFFMGSTTGSGASSFNLVRPEEFVAGRIDHALVVSATTDYVSSSFVSPALRTDGKSTHANAIPEGARLQLDPSFDVSTLPEPWMRVVAKALQEYGAYVTDRGGATALGVMGNQSDDVVRTAFPFGRYGDLSKTGIKDHLRVLG